MVVFSRLELLKFAVSGTRVNKICFFCPSTQMSLPKHCFSLWLFAHTWAVPSFDVLIHHSSVVHSTQWLDPVLKMELSIGGQRALLCFKGVRGQQAAGWPWCEYGLFPFRAWVSLKITKQGRHIHMLLLYIAHFRVSLWNPQRLRVGQLFGKGDPQVLVISGNCVVRFFCLCFIEAVIMMDAMCPASKKSPCLPAC